MILAGKGRGPIFASGPGYDRVQGVKGAGAATRSTAIWPRVTGSPGQKIPFPQPSVIP